MNSPAYLVIRVHPDTQDGVDEYFRSVATVANYKGGMEVGSALASNVEIFEPGSIPFATLIIKLPEGEQSAIFFWNCIEHQSIFRRIKFKDNIIAFVAQGLPEEGLPNDPTPTIASYEPNTFTDNKNEVCLIIDGVILKTEIIDKYREILFEIMIEKKSYYTVITLTEGINLLHGTWKEDIFAISKWPSMKNIHEFWYSDKYQNEGIPLRTGAGKFSVIAFN